MKNKKSETPASKDKKNTTESNSIENKIKKHKSGLSNLDIINSAIGQTKAISGRGLANEGTVVSYDEER
jgi:hypothetical protein